jgi:antitoxin component of RelBE/YafQ-DinJ toxin-antitoxin module
MGKKKITMTIDSDIFSEFKSYCDQNGMKISSRVELLMKDSVKNITLKQFT